MYTLAQSIHTYMFNVFYLVYLYLTHDVITTTLMSPYSFFGMSNLLPVWYICFFLCV